MKDKGNPVNSSKRSKITIYKLCEKCGTFTNTMGRCINIEHGLRKGRKKDGKQ